MTLILSEAEIESLVSTFCETLLPAISYNILKQYAFLAPISPHGNDATILKMYLILLSLKPY